MEKRLRLSDKDQALLVAALTDYVKRHPDQGPVSSMLMARLTGSSPPGVAMVPNGDSLTDKPDLAAAESVDEDPPATDPSAVDTASLLEPVPELPTSAPVPVPVPPPVPAQTPEPVQVPTPASQTREEIAKAWRAWRMEQRAWILREARVVNLIWAGFTNRKEGARRLTPLQQQLQLLDSTVEPPPGWTPPLS